MNNVINSNMLTMFYRDLEIILVIFLTPISYISIYSCSDLLNLRMRKIDFQND